MFTRPFQTFAVIPYLVRATQNISTVSTTSAASPSLPSQPSPSFRPMNPPSPPARPAPSAKTQPLVAAPLEPTTDIEAAAGDFWHNIERLESEHAHLTALAKDKRSPFTLHPFDLRMAPAIVVSSPSWQDEYQESLTILANAPPMRHGNSSSSLQCPTRDTDWVTSLPPSKCDGAVALQSQSKPRCRSFGSQKGWQDPSEALLQYHRRCSAVIIESDNASLAPHIVITRPMDDQRQLAAIRDGNRATLPQLADNRLLASTDALLRPLPVKTNPVCIAERKLAEARLLSERFQALYAARYRENSTPPLQSSSDDLDSETDSDDSCSWSVSTPLLSPDQPLALPSGFVLEEYDDDYVDEDGSSFWIEEDNSHYQQPYSHHTNFITPIDATPAFKGHHYEQSPCSMATSRNLYRIEEDEENVHSIGWY